MMKIYTLGELLDSIETEEKATQLIRYIRKQDKEVIRLTDILNKINKMYEANTHCENIYYAIGVLLHKESNTNLRISVFAKERFLFRIER